MKDYKALRNKAQNIAGCTSYAVYAISGYIFGLECETFAPMLTDVMGVMTNSPFYDGIKEVFTPQGRFSDSISLGRTVSTLSGFAFLQFADFASFKNNLDDKIYNILK